MDISACETYWYWVRGWNGFHMETRVLGNSLFALPLIIAVRMKSPLLAPVTETWKLLDFGKIEMISLFS